MSRIGRMPIAVPNNVTVEIKNNEAAVKGPKGELRFRYDPQITLTLSDSNLLVARPNDTPEYRALHGLTRSLLANMVKGVTAGFEKRLEIVGVGYRAEKQGDKVVLHVGFSHTVDVVPAPGISLAVEGNSIVRVTGIDKQVVGQMAAEIRSVRPPDKYKGKGIRYAGEIIKLKPGKAGKAVGRSE
jgi:large subunit ribosomal protein L6